MKKIDLEKRASAPENLPTWDLNRFFYSGIDDPEIEEDLLQIKGLVKEITRFSGKIETLRAFEFALLVRLYEGLVDLVRKLSCYAHLQADTHLDNPEVSAFNVSIGEKIDELIEPVSFVINEVIRLPKEKKVEFMSSPKLRRYSFWLEKIFTSGEVDDLAMYIIHQKSATESQWSKLYDETCALMEFNYKGKTYNEAEIYSLLRSTNKDEDEKEIAEEIYRVFNKNAYIFTNCLNAIMKNQDVDAKLFGYYNAENESFISNEIPREHLLLLVSSITDSFIPMSRRWYDLMKKLHQSPKCHSANNPIILPEKNYSWEECKKIVLNAYQDFSPIYAEYAKDIIANNTIDVAPHKGKKSGAYCMQATVPYIFLNFTGKSSDINTFAHELGHAVNFALSAPYGTLNSSTPISLAEVASEFAENLVYMNQLSKARSNPEKLYLMIERTNDMIGSIQRQVAIYNFEKRVHMERQKGSVPTEKINQIWGEEFERYTGIKLSDNAKIGWARISHLFNSPFYVYCYAFAGVLVNNLFKVYQKGDLENDEICDFSARFIEMLTNTGVEDYDKLLEVFELDVEDPKFWTSGLETIQDHIEQIEKLAKAEGLID